MPEIVRVNSSPSTSAIDIVAIDVSPSKMLKVDAIFIEGLSFVAWTITETEALEVFAP